MLWHNVTGCLIHVDFTVLNWTPNNAENTVSTGCVTTFFHSNFRLNRIRILHYAYNHVWIFHNDSSVIRNYHNLHWCNIHLSLYSNNYILITIFQVSLIGKQEYRNFCIILFLNWLTKVARDMFDQLTFFLEQMSHLRFAFCQII